MEDITFIYFIIFYPKYLLNYFYSFYIICWYYKIILLF